MTPPLYMEDFATALVDVLVLGLGVGLILFAVLTTTLAWTSFRREEGRAESARLVGIGSSRAVKRETNL